MKLPGHWIFFAHYNLWLQYDTLNILGYQKHLYITNLRHVQICKYYQQSEHNVTLFTNCQI